jgi:ubiquinone/menaquinone biosynthesis C-methylase UbiE
MKIADIGSGGRPMPDANIFVDLYPHDAKQRRANPKDAQGVIPKGAKFIKGDIQNLCMFKDKELDYVYCRHVLEHVDYPEKACSELIRVAKAGLIITPSFFGEIFFGWEYHRWLIVERNKGLFFFQKRKEEDRPFRRFFRERVGKSYKYDDKMIPELKKVFDRKKQLFDNKLEWKGTFNFQIIREEG